MPKFIILMNDTDNSWDRIPKSEQEVLMKRYFAWVDALKKQDRFHSGEALSGGGRKLQMAGGQVVDGPFTETKEVLTGFFLIEAADLNDATQIARGCPGLTHGETIIVRPIGYT